MAFRRSLQKEVSALALEITERLIETTPVDTGWARASWIPSIGDPFVQPSGSSDSFTTGKQELGMAEVATQYNLLDGPIFITNNVPYIERLNEGSSPQAPAGFIEEAIKQAIDSVERRILG